MKNYLVLFVVFATLLSFARNPWLTATAINEQTRPVSAGIVEPVLETAPDDGLSLRLSGTSDLVGGKRYFDLVVSYHGFPDGDHDGNKQAENSAQWSTQDKIEKIINFCADGVYEATEGCADFGESCEMVVDMGRELV